MWALGGATSAVPVHFKHRGVSATAQPDASKHNVLDDQAGETVRPVLIQSTPTFRPIIISHESCTYTHTHTHRHTGTHTHTHRHTGTHTDTHTHIQAHKTRATQLLLTQAFCVSVCYRQTNIVWCAFTASTVLLRCVIGGEGRGGEGR